MASKDRQSSVKTGVISLALATVAAMVAATGLFGDDADERRVRSRPSGEQVHTQAELFGGLSVALRLEPSVRSGDELVSVFRVENRSGHAVTDPGCQLSSTRAALVPPDDPTAELWLAPTVDCQGPRTYEPGFTGEFGGPLFLARTKFGDPLPAGDYIAAVEWWVGDQRLEYPVTVVER